MLMSGMLALAFSCCLGSLSVPVRDTEVKGKVETFHDVDAHLATNTHHHNAGTVPASQHRQRH